MNGDAQETDITILDKVVCCFENLDDLLRQSLSKTRNVYALSFPKPNFFVRTLFHIPIAVGKLLDWSFHPCWHDWNAMKQTIEQHGFKQMFHGGKLMWDVYVFERR